MPRLIAIALCIAGILWTATGPLQSAPGSQAAPADTACELYQPADTGGQEQVAEGENPDLDATRGQTLALAPSYPDTPHTGWPALAQPASRVAPVPVLPPIAS